MQLAKSNSYSISTLARTSRTLGFAAAGLVLSQSIALAQDEVLTQDEAMQYVLDAIDAADSAVQLAEDLYQFDESICLIAQGEELGEVIEVVLDGKSLGYFPVEDGGRINVKLPGAAQSKSILSVYDAFGELVLQSTVLDRTYFRGNVVEAGNYGDHEPDITDVIFLYQHVFFGGPAPAVFAHGDINASGTIDVADVLNLYDHVTNGVSYYLPTADVLHDGSFTTANTYLATTIAALAGWGKGTHCPPRGNEGSKPKDLDGDPKTKEWTFPCTHTFVNGFPGYSTMTTAWGPRQPNPGIRPTGSNSAFVFMLYCVSVETGEPVVTRKPMGKCVWPNGENTDSIANGEATWISTNPTAADGPVGAAYKFVTNLATCKMEITYDTNGDGTFDTDVYSGDPSGWGGWPAGV